MIHVLLPLAAFAWLGAAHAANAPTPPDNSTNSEMKAMFEADQAERQVKEIDWDKLDADDESRRKRTRTMLDAGLLRSADDYYHAAFIFQHGSVAGDYLLAHVLATAAMKRGREDASWIAAATLDRYLQTIGQSQVFGTQYRCRDGRPWMDPYDANLVPDSTRIVLGVPVRAEQEKHGQAICAHAPVNITKK